MVGEPVEATVDALTTDGSSGAEVGALRLEDQARVIGQRVAERTPDFAEAARDIGVRLKTIYEEGLKVAEDAGELWTRGRKLAGY